MYKHVYMKDLMYNKLFSLKTVEYINFYVK